MTICNVSYKLLSVKIDILASLGISILMPDIPVIFSICPINNHSLKNTTVSFNPYTLFWYQSRKMNICREMTCYHEVCPYSVTFCHISYFYK